jgi:hypothetical protein
MTLSSFFECDLADIHRLAQNSPFSLTRAVPTRDKPEKIIIYSKLAEWSGEPGSFATSQEVVARGVCDTGNVASKGGLGG